MIEGFTVRKELWQPTTLDGKDYGKPRERLVCAYFPPHTAFSEELLKSADKKVLKVTERKKLEVSTMDTSEGPFTVTGECQITCSNGGALYLLGETKDGVREAWLWRLTEGSEHA